jgi:hypothetical protein
MERPVSEMKTISDMIRATVREMRQQGVFRFAAALEDATVQIEIQQHLCLDGRPIHDLKGQASCPACGFSPKIVA